MIIKEAVCYSSGTKFLHWLIALLVIAMLCFGFFLGEIPKPYQPSAYMYHKSMGLTILWLMILRIIWIFYTGRPLLPKAMPMWQKFLAKAVQFCLYVLLLAMPCSGWIMSVASNKIPAYFGLFKVPLPIAPNKPLAGFMANTHEIIAFILIALVLLHVAGAMKHYLIDRDKVMQSML